MQDALLVIIVLVVIQIHVVPKFEIFEVSISREEVVFFFSIMNNPVL